MLYSSNILRDWLKAHSDVAPAWLSNLVFITFLLWILQPQTKTAPSLMPLNWSHCLHIRILTLPKWTWSYLLTIKYQHHFLTKAKALARKIKPRFRFRLFSFQSSFLQMCLGGSKWPSRYNHPHGRPQVKIWLLGFNLPKLLWVFGE